MLSQVYNSHTQGVGGDLPDIFYTRTFDVVPYANLEWTINLQPLIDRDGIDTDDFWEAEVTQMIYHSDLYALPYDFSNLAVVYNAGIFEDVGLDVPSGDWDWTGLKEVGEALKEETDGRQTRWGFRAYAWPWVVLGIVHANGGRILSEDQTECVLHSDVNIETFQFFRDLMTDGVAPESGSMPQGVDPFSTGLLGMDSMGSWATQSQRERIGDSFTFDVVPSPYGSDGRRAVSADGGAWGIAANSEYKEVTWEFNVHLTSTESTNILISEPVRSLPGRKSSVPAWNEAASREDLPSRNVEVFAQQMEDAYAEPFPVYWKDLQNIWFNRVAPLMQGGEDVDIGESLQKFQDEVNEIIAIS